MSSDHRVKGLPGDRVRGGLQSMSTLPHRSCVALAILHANKNLFRRKVARVQRAHVACAGRLREGIRFD